MHHENIYRRKEAILAQIDARELQKAHPSLFSSLPVPITHVASAMGVRIEKRTQLRQRAQLEVFGTDISGTNTIVLKPDLNPSVSRFAVAHEIGHVILLSKHPTEARQWDTATREEFANAFATELLAPSNLREQLKPAFREVNDPLALVRLASRVGLSPHALLSIANKESSWLQGLNRIWLRVKHSNNAVTRAEPKLRIVSATFDRSHFYVPTNQSLARFAGDDQWLASLPYGTTVRHSSKITLSTKRQPGVTPKFQLQEMLATLSAVRLRPSATETGAYFIILAELIVGASLSR